MALSIRLSIYVTFKSLKDLTDFKQLTSDEKNYLFKYNMLVYSKLSKFLNKKEKKWLADFI